MKLKEKIIALLERKNYTYKTLADYLGVSEADLDTALETRTLEIRILEIIAKELHIPMYSFFRDPFDADEVLTEHQYKPGSWMMRESRYINEIKKLQEEIVQLKKLLDDQHKLILQLQS